MYRLTTSLLLVILSSPLLSWGIDLQPNDLVAPPPDKNTFTVSYYATENSTFYKNGVALTPKQRLAMVA
ncbi:hypothetical protein B0G85_0790 [Polynucleobacter brandtiae]|uniref:Uncharacterized protein n=1 Tax=Polynucleobacter brandtiae TaxID=1938816 RepID=A0A2M8VZW3_9BURK|nr:hypothetical protein B0G85_0790 [Polynucleobacter brandtiae]